MRNKKIFLFLLFVLTGMVFNIPGVQAADDIAPAISSISFLGGTEGVVGTNVTIEALIEDFFIDLEIVVKLFEPIRYTLLTTINLEYIETIGTNPTGTKNQIYSQNVTLESEWLGTIAIGSIWANDSVGNNAIYVGDLFEGMSSSIDFVSPALKVIDDSPPKFFDVFIVEDVILENDAFTTKVVAGDNIGIQSIKVDLWKDDVVDEFYGTFGLQEEPPSRRYLIYDDSYTFSASIILPGITGDIYISRIQIIDTGGNNVTRLGDFVNGTDFTSPKITIYDESQFPSINYVETGFDGRWYKWGDSIKYSLKFYNQELVDAAQISLVDFSSYEYLEEYFREELSAGEMSYDEIIDLSIHGVYNLAYNSTSDCYEAYFNASILELNRQYELYQIIYTTTLGENYVQTSQVFDKEVLRGGEEILFDTRVEYVIDILAPKLLGLFFEIPSKGYVEHGDLLVLKFGIEERTTLDWSKVRLGIYDKDDNVVEIEDWGYSTSSTSQGIGFEVERVWGPVEIYVAYLYLVDVFGNFANYTSSSNGDIRSMEPVELRLNKDPPRLVNVHIEESIAIVGQNLTVSVLAVDDQSETVIVRVYLMDENLQNIAKLNLTKTGQFTYSATFMVPSSVEEIGIQHVIIVDEDDNSVKFNVADFGYLGNYFRLWISVYNPQTHFVFITLAGVEYENRTGLTKFLFEFTSTFDRDLYVDIITYTITDEDGNSEQIIDYWRQNVEPNQVFAMGLSYEFDLDKTYDIDVQVVTVVGNFTLDFKYPLLENIVEGGVSELNDAPVSVMGMLIAIIILPLLIRRKITKYQQLNPLHYKMQHMNDMS